MNKSWKDMTIDEIENERINQWRYIKNSESKILLWAKKQQALIFRIEFCPHPGDSLDIYIFYHTDKELKSHIDSGMVEKTKQEFMRILDEMGYVREFNDNVRFQFDSDENVKKNYEGNYGFRLR